jgi:lysophospholipase L1-like esterase
MSQLHRLHKLLLGFCVLAAQLMHAGRRTDLPSLENQDPSGTFGDDTLPSLRIVVLGDSSITAPGVEPLDACWTRRVAHHLAGRYRVELLSVAAGGAKARDVIADQIQPAIAACADIAFLSVGANDALRGTPLSRFEREYRDIVAQLHQHIPGIAVSGIGDLGSIPRLPAPARSVVRIRGRSFDKAVRRATADFPDIVKTDTWSPGWQELLTNPWQVFAGDLFHASAYGHGIYAHAAIPAVEVLLERQEQPGRLRERSAIETAD